MRLFTLVKKRWLNTLNASKVNIAFDPLADREELGEARIDLRLLADIQAVDRQERNAAAQAAAGVAVQRAVVGRR